MQGEYKGKPIFKYRYLGMGEDALRDEVDRLQGELYAAEEALDYLDNDYKVLKQEMLELQKKNERLLKGVDEKLVRLQRSLDYEAPIKTQLELVKNELNETIDTTNHKIHSKTVRLIILDTILLIILIALVVCSIVIF